MFGTLEPVILRGSMSKQRLIFLRKAADLIARIFRLTLSHECDAEPRRKALVSWLFDVWNGAAAVGPARGYTKSERYMDAAKPRCHECEHSGRHAS
jgi:hypothetical protein